MKQLIFLACFCCVFSLPGKAQVAISTDSSSPDGSAMLDVKSTSKGLLIPRMTAAQRTAISYPANGLMVYQTDGTAGVYIYNGSTWVLSGGSNITGAGVSGQVTYWSGAGALAGSPGLYWDNANSRLGIGLTNPAQQLEITQSFCLPAETAAANTGTIFKGTDRFIHTFYPAGAPGQNTFVGRLAGNFTMAYTSGNDASYNTGLGDYSLSGLTSGYFNTAAGSASLANNTTGYDNVGVGSYSLYSNVNGYDNNAFGNQSLYSNTGHDNVAIGSFSLNQTTSGNHNVSIGSHSTLNTQTGSQNTLIGSYAGYGTSLSSFSNNSALGYLAGYSLTTGSNNILLGYKSGDGLTSGSNNIIIGYDIDPPNITGSSQLVIGAPDLIFGNLSTKKLGIGTSNPNQKLTVDGNFGILEGGVSPTYHSIFQGGDQAGDLTYTLPVNTGTSGQFLASDGSGILSWSTGVTGTGTATRVAFWNGTTSLSSNTNFYWDNTNSRLGIGTAAPSQQLELTGNLRLPITTATTGIIYSGATPFIHNYGSYCNFMGDASGNFTLTGSYNSGIGDSTLMSLTTGLSNIAIGNGALKAVTTATGNTAVGYASGRKLNTTGFNTMVGYKSGQQNTADCNTFIGSEAGSSNSTGQYNVFMGCQAGYHNTILSGNVAVGYQALYNQTDDDEIYNVGNTAVGYKALYSNSPNASNPAESNSAFGASALYSNTIGGFNSAFGTGALTTNSTGNFNVAVGVAALGSSTSSYNTAIGEHSLNGNTTGFNNTALGFRSLFTNTTGANNTCIGYYCDVSSANFTNTTIIGSGTIGNASNQVRLGNDFVTSFYCMGAHAGNVGASHFPLYVDVYGKIGQLLSSAMYENDIIDMEAVDWLYRMRPVNFTYKTDEKKIKQYGLIAEEVEKVNPGLVSYNNDGQAQSVAYSDLVTPMLKALQEQKKTITDLETKLDQMKKTQESLVSRLEALEKKDNLVPGK